MVEVMLTTKDNPFDPFEDWDSWYAWDVTNGYNTCCYIDRIANVSGDMLPPIQAELLSPKKLKKKEFYHRPFFREPIIFGSPVRRWSYLFLRVSKNYS